MTEVVSTSHGQFRAQTQSRETATSSAEMAASNLEILGRIPESLSGRLIRNGPEPLGDAQSHDGLQGSSNAMLHQISIAGGRADYQSRRISSTSAFGEDADAFGGIQTPRGGPNSGLVLHGGHVRALGALSNPVVVNASLEVESIDDLAGSMPFGIGTHAHVDSVWDEMIVIGSSPRSSSFQVGTVDVKGRMRRVVEIATDTPMFPDTPIFIHDFSFTDTDVVVLASGADMINGGVSWDPTAPAYFGVLPRDGEASDIRWHEVSPRVVWHFMNSYRDGAQIVVDHVAHRAPIATAGKSALLPGVTAPQLRRTQINTLTGETTDEILDDRAVEYPAIDNRRQGLRHRFAYAALASSRFNDHIGEFDALVRYDFRSDQAIDHSFEEGIIVGEPVVVPRRGSTGEDDAWILAIATDTKNAKSSVVVLDPQAFGEAPVAEIKLPQMLPIGHHLLWVPSL